MSILVYKCPQCSAALSFDAEKQSWDCPYCMGSFDLEQLEKLEEDKADKLNHEHVESNDEEQFENPDFNSNTKVYSCPDCGAQIVTDATTAATFCAFCQNPTIIPAQLLGEFRPSKVIPFKFDKDSAKKAFLKWCGKKPLVPKSFKFGPHLEKITGIYLPFWLFNCDVSGSLTASATNRRTWRSGNTEYTETKHYKIYRDGEMCFNRIPADGSSKMDDKIMDLLEPFDYNELVDFSMSYLSGYFAEKYDLDEKDVFPRIEKRVYDDTTTQLRSTINGYSSVQVENSEVHFDRCAAAYALIPVWMLIYKYKGKDFLFSINGQTGKVVGKLPLSFFRIAAWFTGMAVAIFALLFLGGMIL